MWSPKNLASISQLLRADILYAQGSLAQTLVQVDVCLHQEALEPLLRKKLEMQQVVCLLGEKKTNEATLSLVNFVGAHLVKFPLGDSSPSQAILARKLDELLVTEADLVLLGLVFLLDIYQV